MTIIQGHNIVFKFHEHCDLAQWGVVDDVVMGGKSDGNLSLDKEGNGVFKGHVSIENNGGFSSVRYRLAKPMNIEGVTKVVLKIKADGKNYQFRLTDQIRNRYSYITTFSTNGVWQEIVIPLNSFTPSFRGRPLNLPNFNADILEEITFLIANKKAEDFELLIDSITLK